MEGNFFFVKIVFGRIWENQNQNDCKTGEFYFIYDKELKKIYYSPNKRENEEGMKNIHDFVYSVGVDNKD